MKLNKVYKSLVVAVAAFGAVALMSLTAPKAYAADICWDGGGSTNNWSEDQNWAGDTEPGGSDVAVFDNGTCSGTPNKNATIDATISVQGINIVAYTGTITQNNGINATIGSSGYTQSSSTSTFTGGDATSQTAILGDFNLSNGVYTANGFTIIYDDANFSGGTFNHNNGAFAFVPALDNSQTITGNFIFSSLGFIDTGFGNDDTIAIASGTTITAESGIEIGMDSFDQLEGPGVINFEGDVTVTHDDTVSGSMRLVATGTTDQDYTCADGFLPHLEIDKPSGNFILDGTSLTCGFNGDFIVTQGTVVAGTSTALFYGNTEGNGGSIDITGNIDLYNIVFDGSEFGHIVSFNLTSGTVLTAENNLTLGGTADDSINGPGTLIVEGNFTVDASDTGWDGGDVPITFSGTNNQTITINDTLPTGTFTINKTSGTATLATSFSLPATGQDLVISSGTLDMSTFALTVDDVVTINGGFKQGTGNFTASNGNVTVGSTGWWLNNSTGDIDAEGGDTITNNGYIRWDGQSAGCGGTDDIALTRNGSGAVNLAGSGRWRVFDVTIGTTGIYAASPAITIYSSSITGTQTGITNNGTCPSERTWTGSGNYNTAANWTGTAVPGATELAVFDATSTNNMTVDADPADNGFQINLGYSGTITQTNGVDITLDDQGWEQSSGTFTGGDATSDITLANGGDFLMNGGTFTGPAGTFEFQDEFTRNSGTFTHSAGTLRAFLQDSDTQTMTGNITVNNMTFFSDTCCNNSYSGVASGTTITVNGTLTFDNNAGSLQNWFFGPGEVHAKGNITVLNHGWEDDGDDSAVVINGTGTQTLTGVTGVNLGRLPNIEIDKSSGTLNIVDRVRFTGSVTRTQGTVSATGSTVEFFTPDGDNETISGSMTLDDVSFLFDACCNGTSTSIASGTTVTVNGDLIIDNDGPRTDSAINGTGTIDVKGNVTSTGDICNSGCSASLTMSGNTGANISVGSTTGFLGGTFTVNKTSATVTLASALNLSGSGQDLTITSGTLDNSTFALTVNDTLTINGGLFSQGTGNVTAGTYTVGASGVWTNYSTGDIVIGTGGVSNAGEINLGDPNSCEAADNISITSSSGGAQRSWTGAGDFNFVDLTVQDQGGSATITTYSSTSVSGNGGNWTFTAGCPAPPSGEPFSSTFQGGVLIQGGTLIQ